MLPKGPAVSAEERSADWTGQTASTANYTGAPRAAGPVLPFLVFGVPYDLDIVLVSRHPDWDMHEYARIRTPKGPVWLAKDTRESNGDQLLVAESELLHRSLPEVPLESRRGRIDVENRSEGNRLDVEIEYTNFAGEPVVATYAGPKPRPIARRNGSTMNHSRNQALVVLDLSHRSMGNRASIRIGGDNYPMERILGVSPLQLAIRQVQGGIVDAEVRRHATERGFFTRHGSDEGDDRRHTWSVRRDEGYLVATQSNALRRLEYRFLTPGDKRFELVEAAVYFWNRDAPIFRVEFEPALPDVRRPFEGRETSRWVMDVGKGPGHGEGTVEVWSTPEGARLDFRGSQPWWVAERCTQSSVRFAEKTGPVEMETEVTPCEDEDA